MKFIEIKTAFEEKKEAESLAQLLLSQKLVACTQIYEVDTKNFWNGDIEIHHEFVLLAKTKKKLYNKIEKIIKENHSYQLPEIIAIPIECGLKEYLSWIDENTI